MTYIARWDTGSTYGSFEGDNLRIVKIEVRRVLAGSLPRGTRGRWSIDYLDQTKRQIDPIAAGIISN